MARCQTDPNDGSLSGLERFDRRNHPPIRPGSSISDNYEGKRFQFPPLNTNSLHSSLDSVGINSGRLA